jgi:hypothetical protein
VTARHNQSDLITGGLAALLLGLVVGILLLPLIGQGAAGLLAHGSWAWPQRQHLMSAWWALFRGHPGTGHPAGEPRTAAWAVYAVWILIELGWVCLIASAVCSACGATGGRSRTGDGEARSSRPGMASRAELKAVLSLQRLHDARSEIRPDLHPPQRVDEHTAAAIAGVGTRRAGR